MKILFILILFLNNLFAQDNHPTLNCSANGTWVLHIPGAFTSNEEQVGLIGTRPKLKDIVKSGLLG